MHALVPARDHFTHALEIIGLAGEGADNEAPVIGLFHPAVFPHHHRGNDIAALQVRNIETLNAARRLFQVERFFDFFGNRSRREHRGTKSLHEREPRIPMHQLHQLSLASPLRRTDFYFSTAPFGKPLFEQVPVFEVDRHMNLDRNKRRIDVVLLQDGLEELARIEILLILPEQFAFIDHTAASHVKDGNGDHVLFLMETEDIDVVISHYSHLLPFRERLHGVNRVPVVRGQFVFLIRRSFFHLHLQTFDQIIVAAFEKKFYVLDGFLILLKRGETLSARTEASMDVVLQTRPRPPAVNLNVAIANEEIALDQLQSFPGQTRREKRTEVCSAFSANPPGDNRSRKGFIDGQLYIRIGLVIPQKYVVLGPVLLDQIIFEGERFPFRIGHDELHVRYGVHHLIFSNIEVR